MTPYHVYLHESAIEYAPELVQYMMPYEDEDLFLITEEGREGVYKENYWLKNEFQLKYVHTPLSKPRNQETIAEFVTKFIDDHHRQFSTSGPVYSFRFSTEEVKPLYDIFGVNPEQLVALYEQMIKETYVNGQISPFFISWIKFAPHKVLLSGILMDAVQNDWQDIIEACEYLWAFAEYPIVYRDLWPTGVKEDVMNYTVEHLSPKYKVTQVTNLLELLKYDSHIATMSKIPDLQRGQDNVYSDLLQRYRNQFKSKLKNIAIAYYKNSEENASQHQMTSEFDDGSKADQEGHNANLAQIIDKTVSKFMQNGVNQGIVRICADGSKVDRSNLNGYITQIYASKDNRIPKMIENIISAYFADKPNATEISNAEFMSFGLALYRRLSGSKNETYAEMRSILDYWVELINIRSEYNREATIINYTRAIFNYFVFLVNYYN